MRKHKLLLFLVSEVTVEIWSLFLSAPSSEIRHRFLMDRQWLQLVVAFEFGIFCFLRSETSTVRWLVDSKTSCQNTNLTFKRK